VMGLYPVTVFTGQEQLAMDGMIFEGIGGV
jgi:hypothetical protein